MNVIDCLTLEQTAKLRAGGAGQPEPAEAVHERDGQPDAADPREDDVPLQPQTLPRSHSRPAQLLDRRRRHHRPQAQHVRHGRIALVQRRQSHLQSTGPYTNSIFFF